LSKGIPRSRWRFEQGYLSNVSRENEKSLIQRNAEWLRERAASATGAPVLIADDSEADIFFLLRALAASGVQNPVHVARSGTEAIDYLAGNGKFADREKFPMPGIVLLDLKMPSPDGFAVLRWKEKRKLPQMLWVALSNFDSTRTINEAYAAGATTFLAKPLDGEEVRELIEAFNEYWLVQTTPLQKFRNLSREH
jgi:CheY-like chemotaxis protein